MACAHIKIVALFYNDISCSYSLFFWFQGNFGLFGVIYDVTFEMFPEMIVETRNITDKTAEQVFYDKGFLKDLLENNEYVEILWLPFTG